METRRVLVAEDDRVAARVLERLLRQAGYEVRLAHDGKQAWEMYQQQPVPLVITDWMMPEMDGLELCRRLRENPHNGYTYIILLTARDQKEDQVTALESGADDFLTKPLHAAELQARLRVAERILQAEASLRQQKEHLQMLNEELQAQTEQLQHSVRLIEFANRRFAELFENLPIACFTFDAEGILHEWNHAAEQLYGYPKQEVLFRSMFEKVFTGDAAERMQQLMQMVLSGSILQGIESQDSDATGRVIYVMRSAFPMRTPTGEIVGGIVAVVDVSDRVEYEQHLKSLARTDGLTGIANHRAFQEFLQQHFNEAGRYHHPLALALIDVDHFKQFNDTFGHQAGDEVLKRVARILRENVRQADFVARYGGEEFAIVFPANRYCERGASGGTAAPGDRRSRMGASSRYSQFRRGESAALHANAPGAYRSRRSRALQGESCRAQPCLPVYSVGPVRRVRQVRQVRRTRPTPIEKQESPGGSGINLLDGRVVR
jgi:PAS domain S-box-containing protein